MKMKFMIALLLLLLCGAGVIAEENGNWSASPVLLECYEQGENELYLSWQGNAQLYQVYLDDKNIGNTVSDACTVKVKKGNHRIVVYPISETSETDTKLDLKLDIGKNKVIGLGGLDLKVDLATFGLDPKKVTRGTQSQTLTINYEPAPILSYTPKDVMLATDRDNRVVVSFEDYHNADMYVIYVKRGNDTSKVVYQASDDDASCVKKGTEVTTVLEPEYLQANNCIVPKLDEKYKFSVQLQKYPMSYLTGNAITDYLISSKESKPVEYTPTAIWKSEPSINSASQTRDGEVVLEWDHDDNGSGCEYQVTLVKKSFGIKTGEDVVGVVKERKIVLNDLLNGNYSFQVTPILGGEKGTPSQEANVEVANNWEVAPEVEHQIISDNQVQMSWTAVSGIESYHLLVQVTDNSSLLRFVDQNYKKYTELEIPVSDAPQMEYLLSFDEDSGITPDSRIKVEIYGVKHAANGEEQKTATTTSVISMNGK